MLKMRDKQEVSGMGGDQNILFITGRGLIRQCGLEFWPRKFSGDKAALEITRPTLPPPPRGAGSLRAAWALLASVEERPGVGEGGRRGGAARAVLGPFPKLLGQARLSPSREACTLPLPAPAKFVFEALVLCT